MSHSDVDELLDSENWMVRAQAVVRESLTPEQVERLLTDPDATVRTMTANWHREISTEMIARVVEKYPEEVIHFTLHANAPGIVLGHRAVNWVGKPDLERYLDYRAATGAERARMTELWNATTDRMLTLAELWQQ